jgi:hypothetical protein
MLRHHHPRARRSLAVCILALAGLELAGAVPPAATAPPAYPVEKSANNRYLIDQAGVPYLMVGDAPQALVTNITEADAEMYFANRSVYGFNTLWVNLLCTTYTGGRPDGSTLDGVLPFTDTLPGTGSYDLSTPNEAYFAHMDRLLELAAAHGLQLLLDPIETGGWLTTMRDNGVTRCRNYGRYLGTRYRNVDNIIWMSGNDYQDWHDPQNDAVVSAVALGIRDNDDRHLHTVELDYLVSSSLDDPTWVPIIELNATYTYYPTYARLRFDYNRPNFLPTFMVEANYEFESLQGPVTTAPILRKQEYWTMTSGTTGQLYGNGYIWPFLNGWQDNLDTPGAVQMRILRGFFEPRVLARARSRHEPRGGDGRVRHLREHRLRGRQRLSDSRTHARRRAGGRLHADPPHIHRQHGAACGAGRDSLLRSEPGDVRHDRGLAVSQHRRPQLHPARHERRW